ncbi:MAG: ATP-binding protein [Alsobacter sp.]
MLVSVVDQANADSPSILVIYENSRLLPATIEGDRGFSDVITASGLQVEVNAEFLGFPQFAGDAYTSAIVQYLRAKYDAKKPALVVVGGSAALGFWLDHRAELLPQVPVIHMGVGTANIQRLHPPNDVVGVPIEYDAVATVDLALSLLPTRKHLVIVSGSSEFDRTWKSILIDKVRLSSRVRDVETLSGLPTPELVDRLKSIPADSIVYTAGYFVDGAGQKFAPRDAAKVIADASPAPVFGPFDTFIGTGVVGGRVPTFRDMGATAGSIAVKLLLGSRIADLGLPAVMPVRTILDHRQLERWNIANSRVPPDASVQYRDPGLWEQYRGIVIAALAVLIVQSLLLVRLLIERRRRRTVEGVVDRHRFELAHASRLAVAGQLTASIAHEINQPLGAIQSNVAAMALMLRKGVSREGLDPILDDIQRDNLRANDVIRQLRALMERHEVERKPVDLTRVVSDTGTIMRGEARRRGVTLTAIAPAGPIEVMGDRVQIQQVLINLLLNAMDAVADRLESDRLVSLVLERSGGTACFTVSDNGHGIDPDNLDRLFDSFFTTKQSGMGLGLSIVRTLVEAHGGRVSASNSANGGASFKLEFPICDTGANHSVSVKEVT